LRGDEESALAAVLTISTKARDRPQIVKERLVRPLLQYVQVSRAPLTPARSCAFCG
jgi:hypothetical protein